MKRHDIEIPKEKLIEFCRRNKIIKLAFFGSFMRDDFTPESDIDILVEFEPDHIPGYIGLARMERELADSIGRKVDLRTPQEMSRYFRDEVVANAEVLYERYAA
ncbi:MAG: nucleotidyltransferase family protein [Thermoleophilia bacterium]